MPLDGVEYRIVDDEDLDAEARLAGRRVGYAWCLRDDDRLKVADLNVDQTYRHQGIGAQLLRLVLDAADVSGIREVWGVVTADGLERWPGLLDWYLRLGFDAVEPDPPPRGDGPPSVKKIVRRR